MENFQRWALAWWPVLLATGFLFISVGEVVVRAMDYNDGYFIYALDDAYIHMSIAKNLAQHGVWGVTAQGFASASSSPLWTFLIALTYLPFGANELTPLIMNMLFAIGVNIALHNILRRYHVPNQLSFIIQITVIILLPMNTLVLSGMEHVLQILVNVLFIGYAAQMLCEDTPPSLRSRRWLALLMLGALVGSARYEGLFLVLIFCGLFALRWQILHGFILGAVSITPVALFGLIAIGQGWAFLPTSLLVKSDAGYLSSATPQALLTYFIADTYAIFANQHVFSLLVLGALMAFLVSYGRTLKIWHAPHMMIVAFVLITFINVRLVSWPFAGTYARYEAYLIPLAFVAIMTALADVLPRRVQMKHLPAYGVAILLLVFVLNDIYERHRFLVYDNPPVTGMRDIYRQQYQMSQFLNTFYSGATVAANDIGAINYFASIDNIDLWGLGTIEVARLRADNNYSTQTMRELVDERGGQIALIYANWFDGFGGIPEEWQLVGQWQVMGSVILGNDTVSFYAIQPAEADNLREALVQYMPNLPETVTAWLAN